MARAAGEAAAEVGREEAEGGWAVAQAVSMERVVEAAGAAVEADWRVAEAAAHALPVETVGAWAGAKEVAAGWQTSSAHSQLPC